MAKVIETNIEQLVPDNKNFNKGTEYGQHLIEESLRKFGAGRSILIDKNNRIIAGNKTIENAANVGLENVIVVETDGNQIVAVKRNDIDLDSAKGRELALADNATGKANLEWDEETIAEVVEKWEIVPEGWGINMDDFETQEDKIEAEEDDFDVDNAALPKERQTKLGDIWVLGEHRLLCGDSTNKDDVEKLMNGEKVDMVFTDPPYNVSFNGRSGKFDVIKNDNLTNIEFEKFIDKVIATIKSLNCPIYYIWCNWKFYGILQGKLNYKSCIVWAKNVFGLGNGYRHQHEFCLFNGNIDNDINNESDLWEISKDNKYVHPTQKPIALSSRALKNHKRAVNILDLFGGSGSTMMACEQLKRKCYMMELDPHYCDVIVNRWETLTGKTAIKDISIELDD